MYFKQEKGITLCPINGLLAFGINIVVKENDLVLSRSFNMEWPCFYQTVEKNEVSKHILILPSVGAV